jgi:hypothetical protein
MNLANLTYRRLPFAVALCILTFSACEYQVPITSTPTRKVEERLLGDWTSSDGKEKIKVRRLDATIYMIYYDGDLFRAYHRTLLRHLLLASRILTLPTASTLTSFGNCPMMARDSVCAALTVR